MASERVERVSAKELAFSAKVRRRLSLMLQYVRDWLFSRKEWKELTLE